MAVYNKGAFTCKNKKAKMLQQKQKRSLLTMVRLALLLAVVAAFAWMLSIHRPGNANAAAGINETINFQGRLLTDTGAVVPDGTYNVEFKIYSGGDGDLGGGDETLEWTETRESSNKVVVKNGYFSVYLGSVTAFGSSVDWNEDTLWLSINIGGTGSPSYDGEMDPFTRLGSTPYALNSKALGGLQAANFVQLAQGVQTDGSSTNPSIYLNKTAGTANILQLQRGGADVLTLSNSGALALQNSTDSSTALQVFDADGGVPVFNVDTTNERVGIGTAAPDASLSIVYNSASTTGAIEIGQSITLTDTGNVSSGTDETRGLSIGVTRTGASGGNINTTAIYAVAAGDTGGNSIANGFYGGAYGADNNVGAAGVTINLGGGSYTEAVGVQGMVIPLFFNGTTSSAAALQGQINNAVGTITTAHGLRVQTAINSSGGTITTNYGIKVDAQTVGGSNYGVAIEAASTQTLWVASDADPTTAAGGIAFGSSRDTNLYRGAANQLKTDDSLSVAGNANLFKNASNDAASFQIQNAGSTPLFVADTTNARIYVGNPTADTTGALLVLDTKNDSGDPSGVNGAMYYNSNAGKFRCYEGSAWKNCISATYPETMLVAAAVPDTDAPAAEREFAATRYRVLVDLTNVTEFRWNWNRSATAGAAGYDCRPQYATTYAGTYANLDGSGGPEISGTTQNTITTSGWVSLASGAKTDVYLRLMCKDGDGALDPATRNIQFQWR